MYVDRLVLQEDDVLIGGQIFGSYISFDPSKSVHLRYQADIMHLLATKFYIGQQQIEQLP